MPFVLLALLVAAFVVTRGVWLAASPATAVYWEEAYRWMVAHELLTGPVQPLLDYQADHYQGGSLAVSVLTVPWFAAFGESLASFKITALLLSCAALVLLVWVAHRWFGREAAVLAGLGYLAGPPLVAYWGLVPFGSHGESVIFTLGQLWLLWALLEEGGRSPRRWLLFGLLSGLGIWWCPTAGLGVAACAITFLVLVGLPRPGELAAAALGGVVGLLPWLAYNASHDFVGVTRILDVLGAGDPINLWPEQSAAEKLWRLLVHDFPVGMVVPFAEAASPAATAVLAAAFALPLYGAFAFATFAVARELRRRFGAGAADPELRRLLVFPVYGVLFLAGFLPSEYAVEPEYGAVTYRFFLPAGVLSLLLGAALAGRAWRAGGARRTAALVAAAVTLLASATGTWLLATRDPRDVKLANLEGGYLVRGLLLHRKYEHDLDKALELASRVPVAPDERYNNLTLVGIGWGMLYRFEKSGSPDALRATLRGIDYRERARILSGIQTSLAIRLAQLDEAFARGTARDIDRHVYARLTTLRKLAEEESAAVPAEYWPLGGYRPPNAKVDPAKQTPEQRGQAIYLYIGCSGCHETGARPGQVVRRLTGLSERHDVDSLAAFLAAPPEPMPRFDLSEAQRRDLAAYLLKTFP